MPQERFTGYFETPEVNAQDVPWDRKYVFALLMLTAQLDVVSHEDAEAMATWKRVMDIVASMFSRRRSVVDFLKDNPPLVPGDHMQAMRWLTAFSSAVLRDNVEFDIKVAERQAMSKATWGPAVWFLIHHLAYYSNHAERTKDLVHAMVHIMPCRTCREGLQMMLSDVLNSEPRAETPFRWTGRMHNRVSILHCNKAAQDINYHERRIAATMNDPSIVA